jgi:hypothetical protein
MTKFQRFSDCCYLWTVIQIGSFYWAEQSRRFLPVTYEEKQTNFPKRRVLELWTIDEVQTPSDSECYNPLEPFRFYFCPYP